jgi:hypothetical protein
MQKDLLTNWQKKSGERQKLYKQYITLSWQQLIAFSVPIAVKITHQGLKHLM